ncbi:MAG: class I SAM-dependent methyltransferase [Alphaproteobacteria bacterium]|nr:class I SAM-dependent methyltransferase [Alphaproteobacteria bacterium]
MEPAFTPSPGQNHPHQPTDPHLIWGLRSERVDRRFVTRALVVERLISRWTKPDWAAADVSGGAGRWLSTLAPHFRQFSHLDLSADALQAAQRDHPEFQHVEFGQIDLVQPQAQQPALSGRIWNAAFCLDTLLYRAPFVEIALRNIRSYLAPSGIAIIDMPMQFRSSISRRVKGARYRGPKRTFSPHHALSLVSAAGYECLATAYQYRELPTPLHRFLVEQDLTRLMPWPATWMCLVLRNPEPIRTDCP